MRAILVLALLVLFATPAGAVNRLADNPSPYLAMHGQDPVAWREWGADALAEARAQGRPLFVSSGYFACHWCHVMQRESYRNPAIAALLNNHFVPVKLDRELHPALDAYLIDFVGRTSGQAGWPLNVFLTPDGFPLLGLTYAPPADFEALLRRVAQAWEERKDSLSELARRAAEERASENPVPPAPAPSAAVLAERLRRQALRNGDDLAGGFGRQARFPMEPHLSALLTLQTLTPNLELAAFLRLTLDAMQSKGLRDHLGGGFFRYTVDPDWQTPHFEKMLYTQALVVPLYLRAAAVLERPDYRTVARDTLDFLLAQMQGTHGGYIASLSAVDDQGVEGGYYLWRPAEPAELLHPDQHRVAALVWGLTGQASQEAGLLPIPRRTPEQAATELGLTPEAVERTLAVAQDELLVARAGRGLPRDTKQLAGWNGLVLSALAAGIQVFDEDCYRQAADRLRDFLVERLWDGEHLHRATSDGDWIGEATLEDYAYVAAGLRDWARLSGSEQDLALSRRLVTLAWEGFSADGGWRLAEKSLLPAVPPEQAFADNPLPSPAAVLIALTLDGADPRLAEKARQALTDSLPLVAGNPFVFASQAMLLVADVPGH